MPQRSSISRGVNATTAEFKWFQAAQQQMLADEQVPAQSIYRPCVRTRIHWSLGKAISCSCTVLDRDLSRASYDVSGGNIVFEALPSARRLSRHEACGA